MPHTFPCPRCG